MALTAHIATAERAERHGPGPSRRPALDYVQVLGLEGSVLARPVSGGGQPVRPSLATRGDLSWLAPPDFCVAEAMGT